MSWVRRGLTVLWLLVVGLSVAEPDAAPQRGAAADSQAERAAPQAVQRQRRRRMATLTQRHWGGASLAKLIVALVVIALLELLILGFLQLPDVLTPSLAQIDTQLRSTVSIVGMDIAVPVAVLIPILSLALLLPRWYRGFVFYGSIWALGVLALVVLAGPAVQWPDLGPISEPHLDNAADPIRAVLQWSAIWTVGFTIVALFTGRPFAISVRIVLWLVGVGALVLLVYTFSNQDLARDTLLPLIAGWSFVFCLAMLFGGAQAGAAVAERATTDSGAHASAAKADAPADGRDGRDSRFRIIWTGFALVLLALIVAEWSSYGAMDRAINEGHRVASENVGVIADQATIVNNAIYQMRADQITLARPADRDPFLVEAARADLGGAVAGAATSAHLARTAADSLIPTLTINLSTATGAGSKPDPVLLGLANQLKTSSDNLDDDLGAFRAKLVGGGAADPDELQRTIDHLQTTVSDLESTTVVTRSSVAALERPILDTFILIAALFTTLVLFPWLLFALFIFQKREDRVWQVLSDLCMLDNKRVPPRSPAVQVEVVCGGVIDRALGDRVGTSPAVESQVAAQPMATSLPTTTHLTVGELMQRLRLTAFSEKEYVVGLGLLSVLVAAGWYSILYPAGGVGLERTILSGATEQRLWLYFLSGLTPLTAGFLGAYFWCMYALARRYLTADLYPAAFLQCVVQIVLAFTLSLMLGAAVPQAERLVGSTLNGVGSGVASAVNWAAPGAASGTQQTQQPVANAAGSTPTSQPTPTQAADTTGASGPDLDAVALLLTFSAGVSISAGFAQLLALLRRLSGALSSAQAPAPAGLTRLEGIDIWTEARLAEEGVENIQALANAPLHRLVLRTRFPTARLVDWVDQALLYIHTGLPTEPRAGEIAPGGTATESAASLFTQLRTVGIRTASDLLSTHDTWRLPAPDVPSGAAPTSCVVTSLIKPDNSAEQKSAQLNQVCLALLDEFNLVYIGHYRNRTSNHKPAWLDVHLHGARNGHVPVANGHAAQVRGGGQLTMPTLTGSQDSA